jgi:hypothetical protein
MNRQMMMLGAMSAVMGTVAVAGAHVIGDETDHHRMHDPKRKREPRAAPLRDPLPERKDKSASLKRMLRHKGQA